MKPRNKYKDLSFQEIRDILEEAKIEGYNFVAMWQDLRSYIPEYVHIFKDAYTANSFCENANAPAYQDGVEIDSRDRAIARYTTIDNFLLLSNPEMKQPSPLLIKEAETQMAKLPRVNLWCKIEDLSAGAMTITSYEKEIDLDQELDGFRVIFHIYPRGMVYEIGHSVRTIGSFSTIEEARKAMTESEQLHDPMLQDRIWEVLLIGQYKNTPLQLEFDGFPMNNSGVVLEILGSSPNKDIMLERFHDVSDKILVHQDNFVRYDSIVKELKFYDQELKPINPDKVHNGIDPVWFNPKLGAEIKNTMERSQTLTEDQNPARSRRRP